MPVSTLLAISLSSKRMVMVPFCTVPVPVAKLSSVAAEPHTITPTSSRMTAISTTHTVGLVTRR